MSREIQVALGDRGYRILVGAGSLESLGAVCREAVPGRRALVVSDDRVDPLYGAACEASLRRAGIETRRACIPAGEPSKCGRELFRLYDAAVAAGLDRSSFVVALGGGVVGDLAGFLAATYLRGIRCVQVPTSLLAMVDSSVGGKTGIDLPQGKNLVGAFHQPSAVLVDLDTLRTLPPREYTAGLAEVVKYGVIRDAALFARLETAAAAVKAGDPATMEEIVARCCEIKAEVVAADEREGGLRAILNFGHTLGHAVETVGGYTGLLHGEAVAVGMEFAGRVSEGMLGFPAGDRARLSALLDAFGLPRSAPGAAWADVRRAMNVDKKAAAGRPRFVLVERIGRVRAGIEVPEERLAEARDVCG